jgi:polyvinyl alcohol dehydrogenase (cytochrome)
MSTWFKSFQRTGRGLVFAALGIVIGLSLLAVSSNSATWLTSGQSRTNWRFQPAEKTISNSNAANLKVKFAIQNNGGGDVSATPSVADGTVYYPDWAGNLYSVDANSGATNWSVNLSTLTGVAGMTSRTTPTIVGNTLIVATQKQGWLLALSRKDGRLLWQTQLDSHPLAVLTQSPAFFNGTLYIGVSSIEELIAADPTYPCCTFRGSMLAVDASTGNILWKTYTAPANGGTPGGYSGNAVWGSTPAVDPSRKLVYIGTGNNYTVPANVANGSTPIDPTDYTDAILALDIYTGKVVWANNLMGLTSDTWNVACFATSQPGLTNCPDPKGPDYDFGQAPMLLSTTIGGKNQDMVVDGQKSGNFWALDADTGRIIWKQDTGSGSTLGGMEWGSASDGTRIYLANASSGFWAALDPATGNFLWKTFDPTPFSLGFGVKDIGAVSVANGVLYAGSLGGGPGAGNTNPTMFALDAATGQILWQFASGGSVASGPAIANGTVYWGTGYNHFGIGAGAGTYSFYSFSVK